MPQPPIIGAVIRALVRRFGPAAEVVEVERCRPAPLPPGHVRVRMRRCGINPSDLLTIAGTYPVRTPLPFVPGFEGVGAVVEVAPDVAGLAPGDRVLPIGSAGAWQDEKVAEAAWCFRVDPALSDDQAATSYVNPLTALLLVDGYAAPGVRVAVNAGASAMGRTLVRLLERRGVAAVALERDERVPAGARLDLAFDAVGGVEAEALALALRPGGTLVRYGLLSGVQPEIARTDVAVELFWLRRWVHGAGRPAIEAALARAFALVREGVADSEVAACYPLPAIGEALRHAAAPGRRGKVLLRPG
jgi:NADPH:quinone reductase-like Zn-dependent oxidoreductase